MKKPNGSNRIQIAILMAVLITVLPFGIIALPQYYKSELAPPPSTPEQNVQTPTYTPSDSALLPARVQPTVPRGFEDYDNPEYPADLRNPDNIKTEVVFDPESGMYVFRTLVGDMDVVCPTAS